MQNSYSSYHLGGYAPPCASPPKDGEFNFIFLNDTNKQLRSLKSNDSLFPDDIIETQISNIDRLLPSCKKQRTLN